jgi:hypothetical protein
MQVQRASAGQTNRDCKRLPEPSGWEAIMAEKSFEQVLRKFWLACQTFFRTTRAKREGDLQNAHRKLVSRRGVGSNLKDTTPGAKKDPWTVAPSDRVRRGNSFDPRRDIMPTQFTRRGGRYTLRFNAPRTFIEPQQFCVPQLSTSTFNL